MDMDWGLSDGLDVIKTENPHYFCPVCGSGPLENGTERSGQWGVNVRCVEGIDLSKLDYFDDDGLNEL